MDNLHNLHRRPDFEHIASHINDALKQIPTPNQEGYSPETYQRSLEEKAAIHHGELENKAASNHHNRTERLKWVINIAAESVVWSLMPVFAVFLIVWAIHMVCPVYWHWLSKDQFYSLQSILFTGFFATFISKYISQNIGGNDKN